MCGKGACKEEKSPLGGAAHPQCGIPRPLLGDSLSFSSQSTFKVR